jgi:hypothetical protein
LAAARIKLLPPSAMLARLESRLNLLTGGARDLPTRQQTLRSTVDWSYGLLNAAEQTLFRRLAVFTGGCTLEGAEAVCDTKGNLGLDVLDGMASMVDKSLAQYVEQVNAETRFVASPPSGSMHSNAWPRATMNRRRAEPMPLTTSCLPKKVPKTRVFAPNGSSVSRSSTITSVWHSII